MITHESVLRARFLVIREKSERQAMFAHLNTVHEGREMPALMFLACRHNNHLNELWNRLIPLAGSRR